LLAARRERRQVRLADVLAHVRAMQKRFEVVLVEGAGGLLSPLGGNFDSHDLIAALRATPMVVCPNRLGAANHVLLTLAALPRSASCRARVVLMSPAKPEASTSTNAGLLAEFLDAKRIFCLPWLGENFDPEKVLKNPRVRRTLRALAG
jgi:dethiobiotin synthetase